MFIRWLTSILLNALILIVVAGFFDSFYLSGVGAAIVASMILSVLNVFVKPFLILLTFVINAVTLMIAQAIMGDAFNIDGFGTALLASIFISFLNLLIQLVFMNRFKD